MSARTDSLLSELKTEIAHLETRALVSEDDLYHIREIERVEFYTWYDPANEKESLWGKEVHPHIKALVDKFLRKKVENA